jgi:excisionase family DNA binding protein
MAGERYIRVGVAAQRLGVSKSTVHNYVAAGKLKARRLPTGERRILESSVEELLAAMDGERPDPPPE